MLLTLTTTHSPATDLGFLLHKNPFRAQTFRIPYGKVYVFYPEANETRCTASLLVDLDVLALVHNRQNATKEASGQIPYLQDIPYRASTFLSIALTQVLGTAMMGQSRERETLAQTPIPLVAEIALIACEDERLISRIFQPLGYTVHLQKQELPAKFTLKGSITSQYYTVKLEGHKKLSELLLHLYVLLPVFDTEKNFWLKDYEINRILQRGESWVSQHPERDLIYQGYYRKPSNSLSRAISRILRDDFLRTQEEIIASDRQDPECLQSIIKQLHELRAKKIMDLNCGEGHFLKKLESENTFEEIVGMDVSSEMLEKSRNYLNLNEQEDPKIRLIHGTLLYQDKYLKGFDTLVLLGGISPTDPTRLKRFETALFHYAHPKNFLLTACVQNSPTSSSASTNASPWTWESLQQWSQRVAQQFSYHVRFVPLKILSSTSSIQMAIFNH